MASTLDYLETLDDERFGAIYEFLSQDGFGPLDGDVAAALKFRPQAIRKLPLVTRAKHARTLITRKRNAELAYELLGAYVFRKDKELVTEFLDAVGVEHEDGMIEGEAKIPESATAEKAIAELDGKHDRDDVTAYVALCAQTWPEVPRFDELWRERATTRSAT
ncbi:MAG: hypothetical protein R3F34_10210 [Planctomycetota bacterium]